MRCHPGKRLRRFLSEVGEKDELLEPKRTSCCARITSANCANSCWGEQLDTSVASRAGFFWCIFFLSFLKENEKAAMSTEAKRPKRSSVALNWWRSAHEVVFLGFFFFGESLPVQMAWVYFGWDGGPPPATVTLSEKLEKKKVKPRELWMINFS